MTSAVLSHGARLRRMRRRNSERGARVRDSWTLGQMTGASNPFFRMGSRASGRLTDPFKQNPWVYRAIWVIANNLAAAPFKFVTGEGRDQREVDAPDWSALFKSPNPSMTRHDFWLHVWSNLLLPPGDVFCVLYGALGLIDKGEVPREMTPYSGRFFTERTDGGRLIGWTFTGGSGPVLLEPHQVVQIKLFNPSNSWRGMSPIEAALLGIKTDYQAGVWNESMLENGAEVGGILKTPTSMTDTEFSTFQKRWRSTYGGAVNSGKIAILEGGLDYVKTGLSQTEMGYIDLKKWSRDEVGAVFGVPKFLMGVDEDANRSSSKELRRQFWLDTLMPLLSLATSAMDARLFEGRGSTAVRGIFDLSGEESLQVDEGVKLDNAIKARQLGVPLEDIIETFGLTFPQNDLYSQSLVPLGFQPWEDLADGFDIDLDDDPAINGRPPNDGTEEPGEINDDRSLAIRTGRSTEASRSKAWQSYIRTVHKPGEKRFQKKIRGYFRGRRGEVLRAVADLDVRSVRVLDPASFDSWLAEQRERWDTIIGRQTRPVYEQIVDGSLDRLSAQLGGLEFAGMEHPRILEFLRQKAVRIKGVNVTLREKIRASVLEGLAANENITGIQGRIRHVFKVANSRALTIARTETGQASVGARFEAYEIEGVTKHSWITAGDEHVRDEHLIDGETVEVGKRFSNGLLMPLDVDAPAGQTVNCRCDTMPE